MKYLITESQFKLLSELERNWRDFEYEGQYLELKDRLIPLIIDKIESYDENDYRINLLNSKGEIMIVFNKYRDPDNSGEIFYNSDITKNMERRLPHPLWSIHGKYIISDVFNYFFPDKEVKSVREVGIA
jgi:hypothetical protein